MSNQRKPSIVFVHGIWADRQVLQQTDPLLSKQTGTR